MLEARTGSRPSDDHFRLELGLLYFAEGQGKKAEDAWRSVFAGKHVRTRRNYAAYVYRDVLEYGLGAQLYSVVQELRSITGIENLLVRYLFNICVQYRDWEHAAGEVQHIVETQPEDLRYVRQALFRQPPDASLYDLIGGKISDNEDPDVKIFLSEMYTHTEAYDKAYAILKTGEGVPELREAMGEFARRMFNRQEYGMALAAAEWREKHAPDPLEKAGMKLLSAQSREQLFYMHEKTGTFIPMPYASELTEIRFRSYDPEYTAEIEMALAVYDSLSTVARPVSQVAAFRRAEILYLVYHDFDGALKAYRSLAPQATGQLRITVLSRISDLLIAQGEYRKALDFIRNAGSEYRLMVHEEDRLLPQALYVSFMADETDSLKARIGEVTALLPEGDVLYNDVLGFAGFVSEGLKDSLNRDDWLQAERMLAKNHISEAAERFHSLLRKRSPAKALYGMRYLDCLRLLDEETREEAFWKAYSETLLDSEAGDFFMLRYAEFLEKTHKLKKAVEIYEKYLLSYQESMYYESVREYLREKDPAGES
ncbi:MAG: hypothetical protein U5N26_11820 [Candidatus Marinimicrobia bacterium]|nr:hypothetical protein [Candidatus Neomarinimicrobiota bacterium]